MFFQVLETHIKRPVDLRGSLESISVMILDDNFDIAFPISANLDIVLRRDRTTYRKRGAMGPSQIF